MRYIERLLKKYSSISNEFIDDFLSLYDIKTKQTDFTINLERVARWLGTTIKKLRKTLYTSYENDFDYTNKPIKKEKGNGSGGSNKLITFITIDCFKRLCLLTKTKKGDLVREYFIELEDIVNKYKMYIIQGLNEKIKTLENNQKPKIQHTSGIIYIFKVVDKNNDSLYKIGRTENLKNRLKNYNANVADDIDILYIYECDDPVQIEKCIKIHMKEYQYRKYKEVYEVNINILKNVIKDCNKMKNKYRKSSNTRNNKIYLFMDKQNN